MGDDATGAMQEPLQSVGVAGTGIMGAPIARNLARAGHQVTAWNRTPERARRLEGDGVRVVEDVRDLADAEAVITVLADGSAVDEAVIDSGLLEAMRDDALWLQLGTVGPQATRRYAEECRRRGGPVLVDCPVLGTKEPAEQGNLVVLLSGERWACERAEPLLAALSARRVYAGANEEASRLKLVLNAWLLGLVTALAESLTLAEDFGVEPQLFLEAIQGTGVDSGYAQLKGPAMLSGEFPPSFPLRLAHKDLQLLMAEEAVGGTRKPVAENAARLLQEAVAQGLGHQDVAALAGVFRT